VFDLTFYFINTSPLFLFLCSLLLLFSSLLPYSFYVILYVIDTFILFLCWCILYYYFYW